MANVSAYYSFKITYITSHATAPSQVSRQTSYGDDKYPYTITINDIPTLEADGYVFGGWEYNGNILAVGNVIYIPSQDAILTFTAVWEKAPTTYVLVDKSDLVAMADSVREATGSEETFNVGELKDNVIAALASGGGSGEITTGTLTVSFDADGACDRWCATVLEEGQLRYKDVETGITGKGSIVIENIVLGTFVCVYYGSGAPIEVDCSDTVVDYKNSIGGGCYFVRLIGESGSVNGSFD